jgi:hypothetical protein
MSSSRFFSLILLLMAFSVAQMVYRLTLPTDGWSLSRDATSAGNRLVYERNLTGQPSSLLVGDRLLEIEGRPVDQILTGALTLNPLRPANWAEGKTVEYTVARAGYVVNVPVRLARLPMGRALLNAGRNTLLAPGPLVMLLIALFVFSRDPAGLPARRLLLFSAAVFASDGISQVVSGSNVPGPAEMFYRGAYWPAQIVNALLWPFLIAPVFIHLLFSFPATHVQLQRLRPGVLAGIYAFMPVLTLLIGLAHLGQPLEFWLAWNAFSFIDFVAVLLSAISIMAYALVTTRNASARAQLAWVAWGAILTSLGALAGNIMLVLGLSGFSLFLAWTITRLLMLGFPIAVAIAILRYRLFEIEVIVHNTVVYGVLTGLLGAIYFASVILLQQVFIWLTGNRSPVAIVVSTLAIAALFVPLRRWVQGLIDRRMYHHKYDTERILAAFNAAVRNEVNPYRLSTRVVQAVEETMQPKQVSLWLRSIHRGEK